MTTTTAPLGELSKEEIERYSRHLILPEVTLHGQKKLKAASVLLIGAGGLGAPVSMYLAAAGVGRIGMVDFDVVDASNLQRQVLFHTADVGRSKLQAARSRLTGINPHVVIDTHEARFSAANAMELVDPYDIVVDGTDNFPTRYCVNDACVMLNKPNVYGSIFRFEGQATVFDPRPQAHGPCYRCLYPDPPPPGMAPSCAEGGVLGILPGVIGMIQATETIKLILACGQSLTGRLLRFDAMAMTFKSYKLRRDPTCPICGDNPTIKKLIDYEQFCGMRGEESTTIVQEQSLIPAMTVQQLKAKLDTAEHFKLIDVRQRHEYEICHIPQAQLIPLDDLPAHLDELDADTVYVVHCKLGGRSASAVQLMRQAGLNAINVTGGIHAWATQIDSTMATY